MKTKYRIIKKTYPDGAELYFAQYREMFLWKYGSVNNNLGVREVGFQNIENLIGAVKKN